MPGALLPPGLLYLNRCIEASAQPAVTYAPAPRVLPCLQSRCLPAGALCWASGPHPSSCKTCRGEEEAVPPAATLAPTCCASTPGFLPLLVPTSPCPALPCHLANRRYVQVSTQGPLLRSVRVLTPPPALPCPALPPGRPQVRAPGAAVRAAGPSGPAGARRVCGGHPIPAGPAAGAGPSGIRGRRLRAAQVRFVNSLLSGAPAELAAWPGGVGLSE